MVTIAHLTDWQNFKSTTPCHEKGTVMLTRITWGKFKTEKLIMSCVSPILLSYGWERRTRAIEPCCLSQSKGLEHQRLSPARTWEHKLAQTCQKYLDFLGELNFCATCDLAIPFPGMYPRELNTGTQILFHRCSYQHHSQRPKRQKQPKCYQLRDR